MTAEPGPDLVHRLRAALRVAMKARDATAVGVLRSALAALDNAGAVDEAAAGLPVAGHARLAGTAGELGAGEAPRAALGDAQHREIVAGEIAERRAAADEYLRHGRGEDAARLREEADLLAGFLA